MSGQLRIQKRFRAQRAASAASAALERLEDDFDAANSVDSELRINDEIAGQRARLVRAVRRLERT